MWEGDGFAPLFIGLIGLLIGSFLNVVIHRLPQMMERQWAAELEQMGSQDASENPVPQPKKKNERFNLLTPGSHCPACGHGVHWYENIPVLSYLFLQGKCSQCRTQIHWQYPAVELLTGALFFYCGTRWGFTGSAAIWCAFSAALLALAFIDWNTTLLPDDITLPLLWGGLIASTAGWLDVPLFSAVMGAVGGYLSLWSIYWLFKLTTGKEGMGYGDFKLFATLGVWFGWQALVPIILLASISGALVGIGMKLSSSLREGLYVPFGPFLVGAGLLTMAVGPNWVMQSILRVIGL